MGLRKFIKVFFFNNDMKRKVLKIVKWDSNKWLRAILSKWIIKTKYEAKVLEVYVVVWVDFR